MARRIDDDMYEVNMLAHPEDGFYKQKNFDKKTSVPATRPPPNTHTRVLPHNPAWRCCKL